MITKATKKEMKITKNESFQVQPKLWSSKLDKILSQSFLKNPVSENPVLMHRSSSFSEILETSNILGYFYFEWNHRNWTVFENTPNQM